MTTRVKSIFRSAAGLVLISVFSVNQGRGSQQPPIAPIASVARDGLGTGLPPSLLRDGPVGELLAVYAPRNREEIKRLLDAAHTDKETADADVKESRRVVEAAEGRVKIMEGEVKTTKTRLGVANKTKSDSDRTSLNMDLKRQEAELKYIERVRDVNKADSAWLDSRIAAASARVKALEDEANVAKKYDELTGGRSADSSDIAGYRELLKRMLNSHEESANRAQDAASRQKTAASRRLEQLDELTKLNK